MSLPARAVFVLLVVATFFAFFAAQRLKSAPTVANLRSISQHFSPNADDRGDVARIRLRVRRDDDVTVAMVDDLGTEVKRLATAVPATPDTPLRLSWDGSTDDGGVAPEGVYRVRVSLRKGNRAVTLGPGVNLDLTAPRPTVKVGGPEGGDWITGPVAGRIPFRVLVTSKRLPTRVEVLRTDLTEPRAVARLTLPPGVREGEWDGRADGRPAPPGTYQIVAFVRDQAGNVGPLGARRPRPDPRLARRERAHAARPAARRPGGRGGEGDVRGRLARPAVPLAGLPRRRARGAREGPAPDRRPLPGHRAGGQVRRLHLQGRHRALHHLRPVRGPGGGHVADPRRPARGDVVRPRHARRRPRRLPEHARERRPGRLPAAAPGRDARRLLRRRRRRCSPSSTSSRSTTTSPPT